jgi:hypothetical protein
MGDFLLGAPLSPLEEGFFDPEGTEGHQRGDREQGRSG